MWTPTDHWLEITIETLGRWEGWMAQGALQGENIRWKYFVVALFHKISLMHTRFSLDEAFGGGGGGGRYVF